MFIVNPGLGWIVMSEQCVFARIRKITDELHRLV